LAGEMRFAVEGDDLVAACAANELNVARASSP
jgi:hypothetical protein